MRAISIGNIISGATSTGWTFQVKIGERYVDGAKEVKDLYATVRVPVAFPTALLQRVSTTKDYDACVAALQTYVLSVIPTLETEGGDPLPVRWNAPTIKHGDNIRVRINNVLSPTRTYALLAYVLDAYDNDLLPEADYIDALKAMGLEDAVVVPVS